MIKQNITIIWICKYQKNRWSFLSYLNSIKVYVENVLLVPQEIFLYTLIYLKELSFSHNLKLSNSFILAAW